MLFKNNNEDPIITTVSLCSPFLPNFVDPDCIRIRIEILPWIRIRKKKKNYNNKTNADLQHCF
jgi:hypothetical protein